MNESGDGFVQDAAAPFMPETLYGDLVNARSCGDKAALQTAAEAGFIPGSVVANR